MFYEEADHDLGCTAGAAYTIRQRVHSESMIRHYCLVSRMGKGQGTMNKILNFFAKK